MQLSLHICRRRADLSWPGASTIRAGNIWLELRTGWIDIHLPIWPDGPSTLYR